MTVLDSENILLTGLPRSGTTLTCSLLNRLPNCVALLEPLPVHDFAKLSPTALTSAICKFFEEQRLSVLNKRKATSKSVRGFVPTNSIADPDEFGVRKILIDGDEFGVDNVDNDNFRMFIKHPGFFTAALPVLIENFHCFAIVRHPLSVLLSWRSTSLNVSNGRMPSAERFDSSLSAALEREPDCLERQLILLDYFFDQYRKYLPRNIIKYEDIIASKGKVLSALHPAGCQLNEPLTSRNTFFLEFDSLVDELANRLSQRDSHCWYFYDRGSIDDIIAMP